MLDCFPKNVLCSPKKDDLLPIPSESMDGMDGMHGMHCMDCMDCIHDMDGVYDMNYNDVFYHHAHHHFLHRRY
ncbi:hypothetical protein [Ruminiclostridium cellobioparum]|jgi:hypothetical protein|uniref:hypothetical protein n=1 Tax=Ruminiclostridium cellobioparum TaxID=29355 RepID=UPI00047F55F6|nr:hypothetical protein [Ruminiclostridium cellobioparum]